MGENIDKEGQKNNLKICILHPEMHKIGWLSNLFEAFVDRIVEGYKKQGPFDPWNTCF